MQEEEKKQSKRETPDKKEDANKGKENNKRVLPTASSLMTLYRQASKIKDQSRSREEMRFELSNHVSLQVKYVLTGQQAEAEDDDDVGQASIVVNHVLTQTRLIPRKT